MNKCPKGVLNGPCGGYRGDRCEVSGECVWVKVYRRLNSDWDRFKVFTKINLSQHFRIRDYTPPPVRPSSKFMRALSEGGVVVYEVFSQPATQDISSLVSWLRKLSRYVSAYSFVDSPIGLVTYDQLALALATRLSLGDDTDVVLNISGRGRSLSNLIEYILTALALGIHNFISVTGDWPKHVASTMYALDSTQLTYLIRLLADLGVDHLGKRVGIAGRASHVGVAVNQYSEYPELEVLRTVRKLRSGAEFVVTQPVYSVDRFREVVSGIKRYYPEVKVLATYALVDNIRRLERVSELGIRLSRSEKDYIARLLSSYDVIAANSIILRHIIDSIRDMVSGLYISTYGDNMLALRFLSATPVSTML